MAPTLASPPPCLQVNLTQSITVRSLIVYGELLVRPPRPSRFTKRLGLPTKLVINSSFILVRGKGAKFSVSNTDWDRRVTIYLRRCGGQAAGTAGGGFLAGRTAVAAAPLC